MKTISILLTLACLAVAPVARAQEPEHGPIEAVSAFHEALEAGDAEGALAHLAAEAIIYESGGVESSREEYASHHLQSDMKFLASVETRIVDRTSGMDGEHAWVLTRTETDGTVREKPIHLAGTETMILEKTPEGWRIIHIHWSSRSKNEEH